MADVSEPFTLCRTFQKDSLLGIEKHHDKGHVILTFKDRGVLVYNLENRKLVHSLPVQQRREFSSSVIQDPCTKKYIGVLDDLNICQWSEDAANLDDCHQNKVEQPVAQILLDSFNTTEQVVVFRDGSCNLLSKCTAKVAKKTRRKSMLASPRIISSAILHHNNASIVAVAKYKDKQLNISLSKLVDNGVQFMGEWNIDPPDKDVNVINCCFQASNANLISYWSNGFLCVTELNNVLNSFVPGEFQDQDIIHLTCRCISKLQVNSFSKKPVSIATVDSTHVCLCHENKTTNGSQETLSIYDTKFGTRQACVSFEKLTEDIPISSLSVPSYSHILCTDGYICASVKHGIVVCSVTVKESSLASALGKLSQSIRSSEMTSIKPLLCIPHLPDPSKDWKDWIDSTNTSQSAEDEILTRLSNPEKTKTVKGFTKELNEYLESKCLQKGNKDDYGGGVKKVSLKAKDKMKSKFKLSQHFVLAVLSRCLEETKFFPKEALTSLIETRCIPGSSSPDLLKYLIEKNEVSMILVSLKNIQGIPESSIISCVQYAVQADSSVFGDEEKTEENKESDLSEKDTEMESQENITIYPCPFGKMRSNLLCHLLSYPVNDLFLQESIKKLTGSSVITLMKFLAHIIQTAPRSCFARNDSPLDYATALDWGGWIINAHYTSLVLMSDIHGILGDMNKLVEDQVLLFDKLSRLDGYLVHYKYKEKLPNNKKPGLYTVEMIEL